MSRKAFAGAVFIGAAVGLVVGLVEHAKRGLTGMAVGEAASARVYAIGAQPGGDGWITIFEEGKDSPIAATQVPWQEYNREVGSAEVVAARLGKRRAQKFVVGLGAMPGQHGGWVVVLDDVAHECSPVKWLHVGSPEDPPFATHVAAGDLDGDGREEIVVGVGPCEGRGACAYVFSDAQGHLAPLATLTVPWSKYTAGETRPAVGDLDGDGKAEVVVGLGEADEGGWLAVYKDLKFDRWVRYPDLDYGRAGGATWPACVDVNGEGKAALLVGSGMGGGGRVAVISDVLGKPRVNWCRVPWERYDQAPGEARPLGVHAHEGSRAQVLVRLCDYTAATSVAALLDDGATAFRFLGWRKGWEPRVAIDQTGESQQDDPGRAARDAALAALNERTPGGVAYARSAVDGTVTYVSGPLLDRRTEDPIDEARQFLVQNLGLWGMENMDRDLALSKEGPTLEGDEGRMVSFRQTVSGIPLADEELTVHLAADGSIRAVSGHVDPLGTHLAVNPVPSIDAGAARQIITRASGIPEDGTSAPELLAWRGSDGAHLVWRIQAGTPAGPSYDCFVDAADGRILQARDQRAHIDKPITTKGRTLLGHNRGGEIIRHEDDRLQAFFGLVNDSIGTEFQLRDVSRTHRSPPGPELVTLDGSQVRIDDRNTDLVGPIGPDGFPTGPSIIPPAEQLHRQESDPSFLPSLPPIHSTKPFFEGEGVAAHRNLAKVIDYWKTHLGRNSYDDHGGRVRIVTNLPRILSDPSLRVGKIQGNLDESGGRPFERAITSSAAPTGDILLAPIGNFGDSVGLNSSTELDIVAHEFAHLVNFRTSHLPGAVEGSQGNSEAAALNEHMADAFAVFTEKRMKCETEEFDPRDPDEREDRLWMIGDELVGPGASGVIDQGVDEVFGIRSLKDDIRHLDELVSTTPSHVRGLVLGHFLYTWARGTSEERNRRPSLIGGDPVTTIGANPISKIKVSGLRPRHGVGVVNDEEALFKLLEKTYQQVFVNKRVFGDGATFKQFRLAVEDAIRTIDARPARPDDVLREARLAFEAVGLESFSIKSTAAPELDDRLRVIRQISESTHSDQFQKELDRRALKLAAGSSISIPVRIENNMADEMKGVTVKVVALDENGDITLHPADPKLAAVQRGGRSETKVKIDAAPGAKPRITRFRIEVHCDNLPLVARVNPRELAFSLEIIPGAKGGKGDGESGSGNLIVDVGRATPEKDPHFVHFDASVRDPNNPGKAVNGVNIVVRNFSGSLGGLFLTSLGGGVFPVKDGQAQARFRVAFPVQVIRSFLGPFSRKNINFGQINLLFLAEDPAGKVVSGQPQPNGSTIQTQVGLTVADLFADDASVRKLEDEARKADAAAEQAIQEQQEARIEADVFLQVNLRTGRATKAVLNAQAAVAAQGGKNDPAATQQLVDLVSAGLNTVQLDEKLSVPALQAEATSPLITNAARRKRLADLLTELTNVLKNADDTLTKLLQQVEAGG